MRKGWLWLLLGLVALAMAPALLSPLLPDLAPAGHDLTLTFGPKFEFGAASFPAPPLWHPHIYAGHPYAGNPQAMAYYPGAVLLRLAGWSLPGAAVLTAAHVLLAALFFFRLARRLGASAPGSALGGLAWALGGQSLGRIFAGHLSWSFALPWIPLLLLGVHGAIRRGERADGLKAGLAAGLLTLCGAPQAAVYALLAAGLFALALLVGTRRHPGWPTALLLGALAALPLALAQALPTLAFLDQVRPPAAAAWDHATSGSMAWSGLRYLVAPPPFDADIRLGGYGWEQTGYIGWLGLLLALWAPLRHRDRRTLFFAALALFALLFALGERTPLFGLLWHLPLVGAFRTPGRMMVIATLALALLAALGATRPVRASKPLPVAVLILALAIQALDLVVLHGREALAPPSPEPTPAAVDAALDRSLAALPEPARSEYRIDHPDLGPLGLFGRLNRAGLRSTRGNYDPGVARPYRDLLTSLDTLLDKAPAAADHLLDLLAVKWRFTPTPPPAGTRGQAEELAPGLLLLRRKRVPRPWRWVPRATTLPDPQALVLAQFQPTPHDPRTAVTLLAAEEPDPIRGEAGGRVRRTVGESDRRVYTVDCSGPGYLVLSVQHLPGWRATLDGRPAPLLRADGLFMALRIDRPGAHTVEVLYRPPGATLSPALAWGGLLMALAGLLYLQGRKRTRPNSPTSTMPARS